MFFILRSHLCKRNGRISHDRIISISVICRIIYKIRIRSKIRYLQTGRLVNLSLTGMIDFLTVCCSG